MNFIYTLEIGYRKILPLLNVSMVEDFFNTGSNFLSYFGDSSKNNSSTTSTPPTKIRLVARSDFSNKTGDNKNETANLADERTCGEPVSRPFADEDRAKLKRSERTYNPST